MSHVEEEMVRVENTEIEDILKVNETNGCCVAVTFRQKLVAWVCILQSQKL